MKTNIKLYVTGLLLLLAASCSHDDLPVYEDVTRIYFQWINETQAPENQNNTMIRLGYDLPIKEDTIILIPVKLMGAKPNRNLNITAEVIRSESSAVPGEDIEILGGTVVAGNDVGLLVVRIMNDTSKTLYNTLSAKIRLTPNEFLYTDLNEGGRLEYLIRFDSKSEEPNLWPHLYTYLRDWSKVKENLLCELLGVTREYFMYYPPETPDEAIARIGMDNMLGFGVGAIMNRYLMAYEEEHGEPLLDERGRPVTGPANVY